MRIRQIPGDFVITLRLRMRWRIEGRGTGIEEIAKTGSIRGLFDCEISFGSSPDQESDSAPKLLWSIGLQSTELFLSGVVSRRDAVSEESICNGNLDPFVLNQ
jgi:hypothetical protein